MAAGAAAQAAAQDGGGGGRRKPLLLVALAAPLVLGGAGGAAWMLGLFGGAEPGEPAAQAAAPRMPVFVEVPDVTTNLSAPGRRAVFIRLKARLEVTGQQDAAAVAAAMPRILDLFQTYLREMRPEELRGSAGTQRLREELVARANLAAAPARVVDVLFQEIIVQ
ncbi:MAG: flagellar basal body-associated FliL family protein [Acetobacteraceae bacterium]|nr:flagellar basal body-associated FliL family protein [Acetobacteraceae bacterium]MDW8397514.1 flagellar basal body-associated FliL family protein [Acetobacteraceae bacterium]